MINKYEGFIFDLDGTIYRGSHLIPNAEKTVNHIKASGKELIFISNKTTGSVKDYYKFLLTRGLKIEEDEIVNSTIVLKKYLSKIFAKAKFFAIGEDIFIKEIEASGLVYSESPDEIDILIVTLDRTLNYEKLEIAAHALENGARFFAANIDDTCPVDEGEVLDAGLIGRHDEPRALHRVTGDEAGRGDAQPLKEPQLTKARQLKAGAECRQPG